MLTRSTKVALSFLVFLTTICSNASGQQNRPADRAGARAIVVDERLAVLRDAPNFSARLLRRLGRGRNVTILGTKRTVEGLVFHRVAVTKRTRGWLQSEAVIAPARPGDDMRLLRLIAASADFERIARARIFLDAFPQSRLRPRTLLLYGDAAEEAAARVSREAMRRLDEREMAASGAPIFSYFLNYSGLDRYRRENLNFTFDLSTRQIHYDGASWRELVRRYPQSAEAVEARQRLASLEARRVANRSLRPLQF